MSTLGNPDFVSTVNQVILTNIQSPAQIKNATADYNARIDGSQIVYYGFLTS